MTNEQPREDQALVVWRPIAPPADFATRVLTVRTQRIRRRRAVAGVTLFTLSGSILLFVFALPKSEVPPPPPEGPTEQQEVLVYSTPESVVSIDGRKAATITGPKHLPIPWPSGELTFRAKEQKVTLRYRFAQDGTLQTQLGDEPWEPGDWITHRVTVGELTAVYKFKQTGKAYVQVLTPQEVAKVELDGEDTGRSTPISAARPLQVTPGDHIVTVVWSDGKKRKVPVSLAPGETMKLIEKR